MLDRIGNIKGPRILTALGVFAVALSGCAVGPDYRRPDVEVPPGWRLGTTEGAEISNVAWWDQFQDPVLAELVRTALQNNKDLQIATANVDQAFAQYGITRSAQFPQVTAGANPARQHQCRRGARRHVQRLRIESVGELRTGCVGAPAPRNGVGSCEPARRPGRTSHGGSDGGDRGRK